MGTASIIIAYADLQDTALSPADAPLPAIIAQRIAAMHSPVARTHSTAGYFLLLHGAMLATECEINLEHLTHDANGRPRLVDGPDFNISHSRGLVACAIGINCRVGMDVERIRARYNPRLARLLFNNGIESCSNANMTAPHRPVPPAEFFANWAAREATVKAGGRVGLARITRVSIDTDQSTIDDEQWQLHFPRLNPDYAACVACDQADATLQVQDFSASLRKNSPA